LGGPEVGGPAGGAGGGGGALDKSGGSGTYLGPPNPRNHRPSRFVPDPFPSTGLDRALSETLPETLQAEQQGENMGVCLPADRTARDSWRL